MQGSDLLSPGVYVSENTSVCVVILQSVVGGVCRNRNRAIDQEDSSEVGKDQVDACWDLVRQEVASVTEC